jgi:hypothetical protein
VTGGAKLVLTPTPTPATSTGDGTDGDDDEDITDEDDMAEPLEEDEDEEDELVEAEMLSALLPVEVDLVGCGSQHIEDLKGNKKTHG